jgi:hypothetical protein
MMKSEHWSKPSVSRLLDLYPDYQNNELIVTLYPLANQRSMTALENIMDTLNQSNTLYPGTDLVMNFKIATV